ncbi:MAG: DUF1674 domain-containing protein [Gammaproteobacteria bacterium]|nr:DUF1674 domain-containing protein [Gammaproteobacteria bacterium]NIR85468.1 DUF1674 domain-containing protein [Gammaproteobacteria bacterium]NIR89520.1 DUF1674 domain-containing protein [Gammaproteobacteria bacterium]NIU06605.1 DUF1674 domain-containing protein [Gammaproteobacteria bacterium]NIV53488.1 DUF1674 domain-containing protein [Gammaproteobacteria bacterium]
MDERKRRDKRDHGRQPPPREERRRTTPTKEREIGGPPGPEPTRYGDWERGGRCIDF